MPLVLVIDDDESILENLQFNLELYGYTVTKARNGMEGLELFKSNASAFDAVLTDMKMPGLSGLEVIREILQLRPEIGITILTGHGDMENAVTAMREGAFNYLQKPFQMESLILSLEKAIQKKDILIENKRLHDDLIKKNRYLQGLHDSAQRILMNYIPVELPEFQLIDSSCIYRSCDKVGGDMYDVFETEGHLFFYVFDVVNHGILAAINAMIIKAFFCKMKCYNTNTDLLFKLQKDFSELNLELCKNTPSGVFATLFAGCIEKKTKMMFYISAGHIDQYLIGHDTLFPLTSTGTLLGTFENAAYEIRQCQLHSGDRLLLFTDGVTDVWKSNSVLGQDTIKNIILDNISETVDNIVHAVEHEINTFEGTCDDDLTILGLQLK